MGCYSFPEVVCLDAAVVPRTGALRRAQRGSLGAGLCGDFAMFWSYASSRPHSSGVSPVGPAAKAGVKGGDIIIKLGGKDILNIYDYTAIMGELKIATETTISVLREGKTLDLKLLPGARD
jgi:S1-C subfamily serine protease